MLAKLEIFLSKGSIEKANIRASSRLESTRPDSNALVGFILPVRLE
jgi:hypothetical protein